MSFSALGLGPKKGHLRPPLTPQAKGTPVFTSSIITNKELQVAQTFDIHTFALVLDLSVLGDPDAGVKARVEGMDVHSEGALLLSLTLSSDGDDSTSTSTVVGVQLSLSPTLAAHAAVCTAVVSCKDGQLAAMWTLQFQGVRITGFFAECF